MAMKNVPIILTAKQVTYTVIQTQDSNDISIYLDPFSPHKINRKCGKRWCFIDNASNKHSYVICKFLI